MNTLEQAYGELSAAQSAYDISEERDGDAYWRSRSERHYQQAAIYAAVAQAEQLKRIADALDNLGGAYATATFGALPMAEGIVNPEDDADEMMAEHLDNRRRAQERMDGIRRGMGLDDDAMAEARTDYADPLN